MAKGIYPKTLPDFHLNDTHVKLLKYAKRLLKDNEEDYLCYALDSGVTNPRESKVGFGSEVQVAAVELKKFIYRAR